MLWTNYSWHRTPCFSLLVWCKYDITNIIGLSLGRFGRVLGLTRTRMHESSNQTCVSSFVQIIPWTKQSKRLWKVWCADEVDLGSLYWATSFQSNLANLLQEFGRWLDDLLPLLALEHRNFRVKHIVSSWLKDLK